MPIYFCSRRLELTPLQSHDLIELTNLTPHALKSRKLVGLRDALKELFRIFYPSSREDEDWKSSCKEGKHFLDCLDQVHSVRKRPKNKENEFYRLLDLYEKEEGEVGKFLSSLSPPVLLDVICNNDKSELEKLKKDFELYGKECEAVRKPQCKRLRKAQERSSKFEQAWAAWNPQVTETNPSVTSPAHPSTPKMVCEICRQQIDSTHTSIDQRMSPPCPDRPPSGEASPEMASNLPESQQSDLNLTHITDTNRGQRTRPVPKRRRVGEASVSQDDPSQSSPVSSNQPSGYGRQPAQRNTQERVISKSHSELRNSPVF